MQSNFINQRFLCCIIVYAYLAASCFAQSVYTYSGRIVDSTTSEPLIGASVTASDGNGTIADEVGRFTLNSGNEFEDVEVSYIGYKTVYVSIAAEEDLLIELAQSEFLLDAAVITGSRYQSPLIEATTSISIIKPDLLSDANIPSADLALDKVPGVQIQDGQANIRGGSGYSYGAGSRVLILVDGISSLQADAGRLNWDDIPVENIGQIEVLKGAASVLYGSSALNGVINIKTGDATSTPVTRLSTSYFVYGPPQDEVAQWYADELIPYEWNVSALHKQKFGKIDLVASGFYSRGEEVYEDSFNNRGRLTTKLKYRIRPNLTAQLNASYNNTINASTLLWRNASAGQYGYVANSLVENNGTRFILDPSVTYYDQGGGKHQFLSRYFYNNTISTDNRSNSSNFYSGEYQYGKDIELIDARISTGLVISSVDTDSDLFSNVDVTSRNIAAYAQLDKHFGKKLKVTVGSRFEHYNLIGPEFFDGEALPNGGEENESKVIFRAGLNYQLEDYSALRASFGQGYRFPTISEKYISATAGAFSIFPNPGLQSEDGWSGEIGYKQGLKVGGWQGYLDVAGFISQYNDMSEFTLAIEDGAFGFKSQNVGDTEIKGVEFEVAGESEFFGIPIRVIGGYTFIDPKYRNFSEEIAATSSSDQNILKYRTRHNAKADIQAQIKFVVIGLSYQYASEMVAIDNLFFSFNDFLQLEAYRSQNTTAYQLFDARIGVKFDHLAITVLGNNLINDRIMKRPARLEPPRNASLRLDYSF